jgi:hypothetical protein
MISNSPPRVRRPVISRMGFEVAWAGGVRVSGGKVGWAAAKKGRPQQQQLLLLLPLLNARSLKATQKKTQRTFFSMAQTPILMGPLGAPLQLGA